MSGKLLSKIVCVLGLGCSVAAAQQIPFQLLVSSQGNTTSVTNGSTLAFNTEVGQSISVQVTATYEGTGQVAITTGPQILGAQTFSTDLGQQTLPIVLNPGNNITFNVSYKPTNASGASAQLSIFYAETLQSSQGTTINQSAIVFELQGTSPSFQLSYVLQATPNVQPLQSGGTVLFPGTQLNTTALANIDITNLGSGLGQITSITLPTSSAFKLTGLPLFPASIPANQTLPLVLAYTPSAVTTDNDQIKITLLSGTVLTVNLQGSGVSATYAYQLVQGSTLTPVTPPGPIMLPNTNVGSQSSVVVEVQNIGNATGIVTSPSISGPSGPNGPVFQLAGSIIFPQTLMSNSSFTFSINFNPATPGPQNGTLIIGNTLFTLTGNGLGPQLTFSYMAGGGTFTVATGGSVVFSPIAVTQSEQVTFVVTNSGTQPGTISNISVGQSPSPFAVSGRPALPVTLNPGASTQFNIAFTPITATTATGSLIIDTTVIGLTGSGDPPPPLPNYTIQGPSGTVAPQTQPGVSLSLASGYPVALTGTLTLTTSSSSVPDPAVEFTNGLRTVSFVIPANSTLANFAGQGSQVFLQTGTVASSIILTPDFLTQAGGIDITPATPATLQLVVPPSAPSLTAVTVSNVAANAFTLVVTGYSTTRALTNLAVQLTAAPGFNLGSAAQYTFNISQQSTLWFQSASSQSFGGLFSIAVPFSFTSTGTLPGGQSPVQSIASVSATVSNSVGTSSSLGTSLQ